MRLLWVELRDFRNHRSTHLEVPDGLVTAVGANGEGKTNLLEGMFFLLTLSSPRVGAHLPLVRDGAAAAYTRGEVETAGGRLLIEVETPAAGTSKVMLNRSALRRKREIRRQVRGVFFGPDDLDIVRGDPSQRRRFCDEVIVGLWPLREPAIGAYERALRQRNRLLKDWDGRGVPRDLEAWDAELVEAGCSLTRARAEAVARAAPAAEKEFRELSGYGLHCEYRPSVPGEALEEEFRARLERRRADELARRVTLVGPHRDDVDLAVRDLGARSFASHGEAWAAALCLRTGLARAIEAEIGEPPVSLLDDPFSALDPARQAQVAARLGTRGQVLVTVADEAHVPEASDAVWEVRGGEVSVRGAA